MRTGERQTGIGLPLLGPRRKIPSASKQRRVACRLFSCSNGLITAIGLPRSVKITSLPDFTALMALEKLWFASLSPIRMVITQACSDVTTIIGYQTSVKQAFWGTRRTSKLVELGKSGTSDTRKRHT